MKNQKNLRSLGPLCGNSEQLVHGQEFAGLPFMSEFFRFMAGGFLSLTFPPFCSSFLNLYPEAPIKLVSELEATEDAVVTVSWYHALPRLQEGGYL
jgi:hypothetical protein